MTVLTTYVNNRSIVPPKFQWFWLQTANEKTGKPFAASFATIARHRNILTQYQHFSPPKPNSKVFNKMCPR